MTRPAEWPALARDYLAAGHYVWNSGMFAFTADAIVDAFARHAPGVLAAARPVAQALTHAESPQMLQIDAALFAAVPDISIDYAIMEPAAEAGEVTVVRGAFDWSDVGSWQAVAALSVADDDGNRGHGERVAIAPRGTYVHAADRIVLRVLAGPQFSNADADRLMHNAQRKAPPPARIDIEIVDSLERTAGGKTPLVIHSPAVQEALRAAGVAVRKR